MEEMGNHLIKMQIEEIDRVLNRAGEESSEYYFLAPSTVYLLENYRSVLRGEMPLRGGIE